MVCGATLAEVTGISEMQFLHWIFYEPIAPSLLLCDADQVRWFDTSAVFARLRRCGPATAFRRFQAWTRNHVRRRRRTLTEATKKHVAAMQEWRCRMCAATLSDSYEVDHIEEHCVRANDDVVNLQALCTRCHGRKTRNDRFFSDPLVCGGHAVAATTADQDTNIFHMYFKQ